MRRVRKAAAVADAAKTEEPEAPVEAPSPIEESLGPLPKPDERFMKIQEHTRKIDPYKEWDAIRGWLEIAPEGIMELRKELQKSADVEAKASDLLTEAKVAKGNFDDKFRDRVQIWRRDAMVYWEAEKKAGLHKLITEAMIEDRIIQEHSELYLQLKANKREMAALVESLEALLKNVINKRTDLRKILESETRRPGKDPNWFSGN